MAWLQLTRWKNLLIVFFTQFVAWCCVILPLHPVVLNAVNFACLTISTMLIAAAGYIINDYFDIEIDAVNKPGANVLEKEVPRKKAVIVYVSLNIIALALAAYIALEVHRAEWILLQVVCIVLLWFYSTHFKRQFLIGNIVVSLLAAFTTVALAIYEPIVWQHELPVWVLYGYALLAFLLTWMREIVKDMEDVRGDAAAGCTTLPVKAGLPFSAGVARVVGCVAIIFLFVSGFGLYKMDCKLLDGYLSGAVIYPLIVFMVTLGGKNTQQQYHSASQRLKLIMLFGIGALIVYYFNHGS